MRFYGDIFPTKFLFCLQGFLGVKWLFDAKKARILIGAVKIDTVLKT